MLWPIDPARFVSEFQKTGEVDEDEALYFTFIGDELLSISSTASPTCDG